MKKKNWDTQLVEFDRYAAAFGALEQRLARQPWMGRTAPVDPAWPLGRTVARAQEVTQAILETLDDPELEITPPQAGAVEIGGKLRALHQSSWPERVLLKVAASVLGERIEPLLSETVHSFRRGRGQGSALGALRAHLKSIPRDRDVWVLKRDVSSYGDSIQHAELRRRLEEVEGYLQSPVCQRVLEASVFGVAPFAEAARGLPCGNPLVPALENLYLTALDERMASLAGFYARYGDDFVYLASDEQDAAAASRAIDQVIAGLGLEVSAAKRRDIRLSNRPVSGSVSSIHWLGMRIDRAGRTSLKTSREQEIRRELERRVRSLIGRAFRLLPEDPESRGAMLEQGLAELTHPSTNEWLAQAIGGCSDPGFLRSLDNRLRQLCLRELAHRGRLPKREAWRLYRRIRPCPMTSHFQEAHSGDRDLPRPEVSARAA